MSQTPEHVPLQRSRALTGVRAAAVLLVMLYHLGLPIFGGFIGVNVFFVLSGFLITHLLLDERLIKGRVAFGIFYVRRALRLYPALIVLVSVVSLYSMLVPQAIRAGRSLGAIPAVTLYFSNWVRSYAAGESPLGLFEHTWSLSIEEQFYLVWPLILWASILLGRKLATVAMVAIVGSIASLGIRFGVSTGEGGLSRISNGTDTLADQLLLGALLAVLVIAAVDSGWRSRLCSAFRCAFWPAIVFMLAAIVLWPHHGDSLLLRAMLSLIGLSASVIIGFLYLSHGAWPQRLLSTRVDGYVGDRSYGLYLWHYPIFTVLLSAGISGLARVSVFVLAFCLAFVFAEASYRFVERPFLSMKERLATKDLIRGVGAIAAETRLEVGSSKRAV